MVRVFVLLFSLRDYLSFKRLRQALIVTEEYECFLIDWKERIVITESLAQFVNIWCQDAAVLRFHEFSQWGYDWRLTVV